MLIIIIMLKLKVFKGKNLVFSGPNFFLQDTHKWKHIFYKSGN